MTAFAPSLLPMTERCPFCDSEVQVSGDSSYIDAARAELQHIRVHLTELEKAERDLAKKRSSIESIIEKLENKKRSIDTGVSLELKPRLTELKEKLSTYRYILELNKELEVIQNEERTFNKELTEKETEPNQPKFSIHRPLLRFHTCRLWRKLIAILKACHYEGAGSARLNITLFD